MTKRGRIDKKVQEVLRLFDKYSTGKINIKDVNTELSRIVSNLNEDEREELKLIVEQDVQKKISKDYENYVSLKQEEKRLLRELKLLKSQKSPNKAILAQKTLQWKQVKQRREILQTRVANIEQFLSSVDGIVGLEIIDGGKKVYTTLQKSMREVSREIGMTETIKSSVEEELDVLIEDLNAELDDELERELMEEEQDEESEESDDHYYTEEIG